MLARYRDSRACSVIDDFFLATRGTSSRFPFAHLVRMNRKYTSPKKDEDQQASADHVERGGEVHADTPDKWSEDDKARQEQGLPRRGPTDGRRREAS